MRQKRKQGKNAKRAINATRKPREGSDAITGLSIDLDTFGLLESDKVYGPDLFRRLNANSELPPQGDSWLEVELGKDKIVFTTKFVGYPDSFIDESYQRGVFTGSFTYKKGKLVAATVDGASAYNVIFKDGEIYLEDAYIDQFSQPRKVSDVASIPAWEFALREEGAETIFFAQESKEFNTDQGAVADIFGFLGGRIYEDEYWKNPFEPNLI
ncbi:MAG: hypothetical protein ACO3NZ_13800 [Pirellulales bacterium]